MMIMIVILVLDYNADQPHMGRLLGKICDQKFDDDDDGGGGGDDDDDDGDNDDDDGDDRSGYVDDDDNDNCGDEYEKLASGFCVWPGPPGVELREEG